MRTIYKYALGPLGVPTAIKSEGAPKPIHAGLDPNGVPCMWMEVTPGGGEGVVDTKIIGTGHEVPVGGGWAYFKTYLDGPFVWHVYVRPVSD